MKGILLAGGSGTRLWPLTQVVSKQLLPVYDKPLIYYPLSTLFLAGIRQILIISTPQDTVRIQSLLGDGSQLGCEISYCVQPEPKGIAQAFILGAEFIGSDSVSLILGDNIFYGSNFRSILRKIASDSDTGATILAYPVKDPERFGVVQIDKMNRAVNLAEKPKIPMSNLAVVGLYFYDNNVVEIAKTLKPSMRGELEITDLNNIYLQNGKLKVQTLGRGFAWLDAGTPESMLEAGNFIKTIEDRQGFKISCIEEIAFRMGYISISELETIGKKIHKSSYGEYILHIVSEELARNG